MLSFLPSRATAVCAAMALVGVSATAGAQQSIPDLAEQTLPSVVRIETFGPDLEPLAGGSGFFISPDGKLVSNFHVIDGASSALVKLNNGAIYNVEGFLAASQENDIAILKVAGTGFESLLLGEPANLRVGEPVVAIGSPLGRQGTVSTGIVSALRSAEGCEGLASRCIQTTAPMSQGSSGGPLLSMDGRVVGLTSALVPVGQNINFAVSADLVKALLDDLQPVQKLAALHTPLFLGAEPTIWTSTRDGTEWRVRRIEETIYSERLAPASLRDLGFSAVCEYTYDAASRAWEGVCRVRAPLNCGGREKLCELEIEDALTSVRPEQITRITQTIHSINCFTCTVTDRSATELALLPREPVGSEPRPARELVPSDRLTASIKGKVVGRSDDAWSFSWELSLTNHEAKLLEAEATIQFLDDDGLVIGVSKESGLQVPPSGPVTVRGVTELDPDIAAQVRSLGVKVRAKAR